VVASLRDRYWPLKQAQRVLAGQVIRRGWRAEKTLLGSPPAKIQKRYTLPDPGCPREPPRAFQDVLPPA
jgi:hypothetical protein